jgi:hypothetical protein
MLTTLHFHFVEMCVEPTSGHKNSKLFLDHHAVFVHNLSLFPSSIIFAIVERTMMAHIDVPCAEWTGFNFQHSKKSFPISQHPD